MKKKKYVFLTIFLTMSLLLVVAVVLFTVVLQLQSGNMTENKEGVTEKVEPTERYGLSKKDFQALRGDGPRTEQTLLRDGEFHDEFEITIEIEVPLDELPDAP